MFFLLSSPPEGGPKGPLQCCQDFVHGHCKVDSHGSVLLRCLSLLSSPPAGDPKDPLECWDFVYDHCIPGFTNRNKIPKAIIYNEQSVRSGGPGMAGAGAGAGWLAVGAGAGRWAWAE